MNFMRIPFSPIIQKICIEFLSSVGSQQEKKKSTKYIHLSDSFYLYLDSCRYREWGWQIFESFEKHTKVDSGGYTSLGDVTVLPPQRRDKMETFFLGETLKYLYLLFGDNSVLPLDKFVFNSEAHPFPINQSYRQLVMTLFQHSVILWGMLKSNLHITLRWKQYQLGVIDVD